MTRCRVPNSRKAPLLSQAELYNALATPRRRSKIPRNSPKYKAPNRSEAMRVRCRNDPDFLVPMALGGNRPAAQLAPKAERQPGPLFLPETPRRTLERPERGARLGSSTAICTTSQPADRQFAQDAATAGDANGCRAGTSSWALLQEAVARRDARLTTPSLGANRAPFVGHESHPTRLRSDPYKTPKRRRSHRNP